jgi:hypothetical protein
MNHYDYRKPILLSALSMGMALLLNIFTPRNGASKNIGELI